MLRSNGFLCMCGMAWSSTLTCFCYRSMEARTKMVLLAVFTMLIVWENIIFGVQGVNSLDQKETSAESSCKKHVGRS